jgi:hypothetical protein
MNEKFLNELNNQNKKEAKISQSKEDLLSAIERVEKLLSEPLKVEKPSVSLTEATRKAIIATGEHIKHFKSISEQNKFLIDQLNQSNEKVLQEQIKGEKTKHLKYSALLLSSIAVILFFVWVFAFGRQSWTEHQRSEAAERKWHGAGYDSGYESGASEMYEMIWKDVPVNTQKWMKKTYGNPAEVRDQIKNRY